MHESGQRSRRLPFTQTQFLEVFAAYNGEVWPFVVVLWLATAALTVGLVRGRRRDIALGAVLVVHSVWSGIMYFALFFTRINAAASLFSVLFLVQAAALAWVGLARRSLSFSWSLTPRHALAAFFLVALLGYPGGVWLAGHRFPAAPAYAVPCPTTLFTAGLLLIADPVPSRWLLVIPVIWSAIGGTAALALGMTPDLLLFAAGACLVGDGIKARRVR